MNSTAKTTGSERPMRAGKRRRPRVPPRQQLVERLRVLTYGKVPAIDLSEWRFGIFGAVEEEVVLTWSDFMALPNTQLTADFHCATLWSRLDNLWEGVLVKDVLKLARPLPEARHALIYSHGGYTTNVDLAALVADDVIFARKHEGQELEPEHGWPLRLVVPSRYAWKSAKWVCGVELSVEEKPGFWETRGFNLRADPWKEERFWPEIDLELALTVALCTDKL